MTSTKKEFSILEAEAGHWWRGLAKPPSNAGVTGAARHGQQTKPQEVEK